MSDSCSHVQSVHHVEFHVSNALQSAFWYCCNFGFRRFAARRCETTNEIAVRNGNVILVFKCALKPNFAEVDARELAVHGDFVKDVAFCVDNIHAIIQRIDEVDPKIVLTRPTPIDGGAVTMARVRGCGGASIVHTLIQKSADYRGPFLPGFTHIDDYALNSTLHGRFSTPTTFDGIDHVVEGHAEGATEDALTWYARTLALHRFWSIDDASVYTEYSALRASIVANEDRRVQVVIAEPVRLKRDFRGQIQEFIDYNGGHGVQHVAFCVSDICAEVARLRERGAEFLHIPDAYYDELKDRLAQSNVQVVEDLEKTFTKPMQDRPTFFVEIIQRHNFNGFGAGNFKALFAAVEREQQRRAAETLSTEANGAQSK